MNRILPLLFCLYAPTLFGQMYPVYSFSAGEAVASNCSQITTSVYDGWELFQTEDNNYNGIHTLDFCGAYADNAFKYFNADLDKAIFIKNTVEQIPLEPNQSYTIQSENVFGYSADFSDPNLCGQGICQGAIIEVEVPDDPNDLDDLPEIRTHYLEAVYVDGLLRMPCFASEYFENQKIVSFIIRVFPQGIQGNIQYPYLELWKSEQIQEIDTAYLLDDVFNNNIYFYNDFSAYMVMHDPLSFPSAQNVTFAEAASDVDNTQVQDITIGMSNYSTLVFQPFTDIRGALIEGSETERHNVILTLENANVCITYYFFEIVMEPGDELAITKANVMMNHGSCIRIEKDATLRINENSHFDYGYNGEGMIALNSGSSLILEKNASIEFNSIFSMWENPWEETPSNIEIYVNPGNKLVFGKYSSIANKSIDNRMKLVIHANGGLVDLSGLSDEDLEHVIVVYPTQSNDLEILQCTSLTADGSIFTAIHCTQEGKANYVITDMSGREIEKGEIKMNSGYNTFHFNLPSSSPDAVILSINQNKSQVSRKLVLVD